MRTPALIAALLLPVFLHAQRTIKGLVADGTRSPLPFAAVQTAGKSKAFIAAVNGRFAISVNEGSGKRNNVWVTGLSGSF